MTNKTKIKRLQKQNDNLIRQNMELWQKTSTVEYVKKLDKKFEEFDDTNDKLLKLYRKLHRCRLQNKRTGLRYRLGIIGIKIRQVFENRKK